MLAPLRRPADHVWLIIGIAGAVVVAAIVVMLVLISSSTRSRERIETTIRERGEPLHAKEIAFEGADASPLTQERITRLETAVDAAPEALSVLSDDVEELERALAWEPVRQSRALLEEYRAVTLSMPKGDGPGQWLGRMASTNPPAAPSERDVLTARVAALLLEPLMDAASDVCLAERETGETGSHLPSVVNLMLGLRVPPYLASVHIPVYTLPHLALQGTPEEALARWRIAWYGSQRLRGTPNVFGHAAWTYGTGTALTGLRCVLLRVPPELDLADVEALLRGVDAQACAVRACIGERALGNDVFDGLAKDLDAGLTPPWWWRWLSDADRATYLEHMTESARVIALHRLGADAAREPIGMDIVEISKWSFVTRLTIPDMRKVELGRLSIEAGLRAAIVALVARRGGAEDVQRAARELVDPYDGQPMRTRLRDDGVLEVWSIGPDLRDDQLSGVPSGQESDDVVWRVRLRAQ